MPLVEVIILICQVRYLFNNIINIYQKRLYVHTYTICIIRYEDNNNIQDGKV